MSEARQMQYLIDADDRIVFVSGDWDLFAEENDASELKASKIIDRSLWQFVKEETTRQVYAEVLKSVRTGKAAEFTMRCDGPSVRRLVEISLKPLPGREVEFTTRILATKERALQPLLSRSAPRSNRKVNICAWCDRVQVGPEEWREVEDAAEPLELSKGAALPQLAHVVCPHCMEKMAHVVAGMDAN
jgi:hypothetical protein